MHTLPLPEVQIDLNSNTKHPSSEKPSPSVLAGAKSLRPDTQDSESRISERITQPSSPTPQGPSPESRIPSPGPRVPAVPPRAFGGRVSLSGQQLQFLLRVAPAALASERQYEVPACVTIAQAIVESATPKFGWGSSTLFRLANNPFGIKYCHFGPGQSAIGSWGRQTIEPSPHRVIGLSTTPEGGRPMNPTSEESSPEDYGHFDAATWEIENGQKKVMVAEFQRFPNLEEAFRAHALLLRAPRYRPAFAVRDDWRKFAERLGPKASPTDTEHCGYSTNPCYSAELINLVTLYRLDDPRALGWLATGEDPGHLAVHPGDGPAISSSVHGAPAPSASGSKPPGDEAEGGAKGTEAAS